jgi:predicted PurR-regulated permease PerM
MSEGLQMSDSIVAPPADDSEDEEWAGTVAAIAESPPPKESNRGINVAVGILAVIALVAALYVAHAFFIPLLIGMLVSYALRPLVDWLKACYVPRFIGAALVLAVLSGSLIWVAVAVSGQAATMLEKLPDAARQLRHHLIDTRTGTPTVLDNVQEAAKELQAAAAAASVTKTAPAPKITVAREPEIPNWLRDYVLGQSGLVLSVAAQAPIVLLLTYFLLASGEHFRRKLVQLVGPSLSRKKDAVRILEGISEQVQRYLLANLVANTLVGVGTWLAFLALGMEQAGAWGVAAGILHFIPYLGPVLTGVASGVVAFVQFGSPLTALAVAGVSILVAGAIGFGFMTWLQSRFAHVNAAVLFIALLFFGWLWGVWGLLLGAPLLAVAKVVCDHVDSLKPVGELLGS